MQSLNRGKNLLLSDVQLTAHLLGKNAVQIAAAKVLFTLIHSVGSHSLHSLEAINSATSLRHRL